MVVKKVAAIYTLNKMKRILRQSYRLYRRKKKTLDPKAKERIQSNLSSLRTAILRKDAPVAVQIGTQLTEATGRLMPKNLWDKVRDFVCAIGFALIVAVVIRTM